MVKKVNASYLFKVKGTDGAVTEWLVDLKNGSGVCKKGGGR